MTFSAEMRVSWTWRRFSCGFRAFQVGDAMAVSVVNEHRAILTRWWVRREPSPATASVGHAVEHQRSDAVSAVRISGSYLAILVTLRRVSALCVSNTQQIKRILLQDTEDQYRLFTFLLEPLLKDPPRLKGQLVVSLDTVTEGVLLEMYVALSLGVAFTVLTAMRRVQVLPIRRASVAPHAGQEVDVLHAQRTC